MFANLTTPFVSSPILVFTAAAASRDSEMATKDVQDPRIPKIASSIRVIPDFPKPGLRLFRFSFLPLYLLTMPSSLSTSLLLLICVCLDLKKFLLGCLAGIMFQDITTLLLDTEAFKDTIDMFVERYKGKDISVVAGNFHFLP